VIVKITGCFVIGFFFAIPDRRLLIGSAVRQFVMTGMCGGYTTFSSFSLQTLNLVRDGEMLRAGANVGPSVALCLMAGWLGHVAASALNQLQMPEPRKSR
jgi:CrcB protein